MWYHPKHWLLDNKISDYRLHDTWFKAISKDAKQWVQDNPILM